MKKTSDILTSFLNALMVISLGGMAILVFGNVVLRYGFNSGINWSSEVSRFLFIWLIFTGAIGALKDNEHMRVNILIKKMSPLLQKITYMVTSFISLLVLYFVLNGSVRTTIMNMDTPASATGIPLSFIYASGILMSGGMITIILYKLFRIIILKDNIRHYVDDQSKDIEY